MYRVNIVTQKDKVAHNLVHFGVVCVRQEEVSSDRKGKESMGRSRVREG